MNSLTVSEQHNQSPFDSIRRFDNRDQEYWLARELMKLLGYAEWRNFSIAVKEAKENLELSEICVTDHFLEISTKSQGRDAIDYQLTRLACYHVALACNGKGKPMIARAKHYFAVKTRQAEISQHQLPQTFAEALMAAAKAEMERERLAIENKLLLQENEELSEAVDELFSYSSIIRVAKFNNCSEKQFNWRKLKAVSMQMGLEIKQVPCNRYVTKNLYSHDAWRIAYPNFSLPETTTIRLAS